MSENELITKIKNQLTSVSDKESDRDRQRATARKGNNEFAENVGIPVHNYLDTVYWDRIVNYINEQIANHIKDYHSPAK